MFGFLKKNSSASSINFCRDLASKANIESVLEQGSYSGFLIHLDIDSKNLAPHFKHEEARSALVEVVESRINDGDFDDLLPQMNYEQLGMQRPTHDFGKADAVRAVLGRGNSPLFTWNR